MKEITEKCEKILSITIQTSVYCKVHEKKTFFSVGPNPRDEILFLIIKKRSLINKYCC